MKHIVQFTITHEDGAYTADGVNVPIREPNNSPHQRQSHNLIRKQHARIMNKVAIN